MEDRDHHITKHWVDVDRFEGWLWMAVFAVFVTGMFFAISDVNF